jgi:NTE family protein
LLDVSSQSLHAVLADGMIEDLRTLDRTNTMVEQAAQRNIKLLKNKNVAYRKIAIYVVAPENGVLSPLALKAEAMVAKRAQLLDMTLSRLLTLAGSGSSRNELLSYLLFEPEFFQLQFDQAVRDAKRKLKEWNAAPAQAAQ